METAKNLLIREYLNGTMFPLSLCFLFWTVWFLARVRFTYGVRTWLQVPGVAVACVLAWVFLGDTVRSGVVWYILKIGDETNYEPLSLLNTLLVYAGFVTIIGLTRGIYVFSKNEVGHVGWISSVIFTVIFLAIASYVH